MPEADEDDARRQRKAAKRAAFEAALEDSDAEYARSKTTKDTDEAIQAEWAAERKRKKAAKKLAAAQGCDSSSFTKSVPAEAVEVSVKKAAPSEAKVESVAQASADDAKIQAEWAADKKRRKAAKRAASGMPGDGTNAYATAAAVDIEEAPVKRPKVEKEGVEDSGKVDAPTKGAKKKTKGSKKLEMFVAGLPFARQAEEVREYFEAKCGEVAAFRMPSGNGGKHKGMAFIKFRDDEACCKCLELNGKDYGGRNIIVHRADPDPSAQKETPIVVSENKGSSQPAKKEFELFVGGLPFETTEAILRKDFAECGDIVALRMVKNNDGQCKGVAFVEYKDKDSCDKALKFDGTDYGGRVLKVRLTSDTIVKESPEGKGKGKEGGKSNTAKGQGKSYPKKTNKEFQVFLGGLPFGVQEEVLKADFEECGPILSLRVPLNDEGLTKGIAFIEFGDKESCDKALAFNETDYGGRTIYVRLSEHAGGSRPIAEDPEGKNATAAAKASSGAENKKFASESDDE